MRTTTSFLLLLALAASAAAETPAEKARAHLAIAQRYFKVQQFDKAIEELQRAYVLDPRPEYLYAIGQAFRMAGDCAKAIRSYEQYLKTNPPEVEAEKARTNIERCKEDLAAQPPPAPDPPPPLVVTAAPPAPPPPPPPTPWTRDYVGHALVVGGVAVGVVGAILYTRGRSTIADINAAPTYDDFASRRTGQDGAELRQRVGVTAIAAGSCLVIGGVLHYALADRTASASHTVLPSVAPGHAMLVLTRAF